MELKEAIKKEKQDKKKRKQKASILAIRINNDERKYIRSFCKKNRISQSDLIRTLLKQYIFNNDANID